MFTQGTPGLAPIVVSAPATGLNVMTEPKAPAVNRAPAAPAADRFFLNAIPRPLICKSITQG
jgi:hypothetical protein